MTTYGQWNGDGTLSLLPGDNWTATDFNDTIDETMPPIGSLLTWAKNFTGVPASLPLGWLECDGSVISDSDSPLNGQTLPDFQTAYTYMRGNTTSGGTGGTTSHTHTTGASNNNDTRDNSPATGARASGSHTHILNAIDNNPPFYEVVVIMRIK